MAAADFEAWIQAQGARRVESVFSRLGRAATESGALRIQMAGSWLLQLANHASTTPFERLYRGLPEDGMFTARPERPSTLELGVYTVPQQMVLLILDWRFDIYRFNGAIVGDVVPITDRELALSIGWDIRFSGRRTSDVEYQIAPAVTPTGSLAAYASNPNPGFIPSNGGPIPLASQDAFDRQRALLQQPSDTGRSMQPQRHRRDVQPEMPFTYVVESNQRVQFLAIAFQPVSIPLAFFEAEFSGLLLGENTFKEFLNGAAASAPK